MDKVVEYPWDVLTRSVCGSEDNGTFSMETREGFKTKKDAEAFVKSSRPWSVVEEAALIKGT